MNFKDIHIGSIIKLRVTDCGIKTSRICNFIICTEKEVGEFYESKSLDSEVLLRWSKLLKYDFFRIYSQYMVLYAPTANENPGQQSYKKIFFTKISQEHLHNADDRFHS